MLDLRDFGARCDNASDDTAALLKAIDAIPPGVAPLSGGGDILIPGPALFSQTLLLSGQNKRIRFVGIGGAPATSRLVWIGPDTLPAIKIVTVSGWGFRDLLIERRTTGGPGAHVGVWATHSVAGSGGGLAEFDNVEVAGFHIGIRVGDAATQAAQSEIAYRRLILSYNDIGWQAESGNALAHLFDMLCGTSNGVMLNATGSDCVWIKGGSVTASVTADLIAANAGVFAVSDFRSEGATRHVIRAGQTSQPTVITVKGCRFGGNADPSVPLVTGGGGCSLMTLIGNQISGRVVPNTGNCVGSSLTMIGNAIEDAEPFRAMHAGIRWRLEGNTRIGVSPPQVFTDASGTTS